jgi:predicted  nucleic acid-binding Zn-ribbon protein
LPRIHADAVGAALASISGGAGAAVRDSRPANGQVFRWLLAARCDAAGKSDGFFVHGIDVSDLAQQAAETLPDVETRQAEIQALRSELEEERRLLAAARQALLAANEEAGGLAAALAEHDQRAAGLRDALATAEAHLAELQAELEQQRREAAEERHRALEAEQAGGRLADALDAERARCSATMAALAAAEQVPVALRTALGQARQGLRSELDELMNRIFNPLLDEPGRAPRRGEHDKKVG